MRKRARRVFYYADMKTLPFPLIRYFLLAWLIVGLVGIMAIPFMSPESAIGLAGAFRSMHKFLVPTMLLTLGVYCIWKTRTDSEVRRSREVCKEAYGTLYRHFSEHAVCGESEERCRQLQDTLEAELNRHCWFHEEEFKHPEISGYRRYLQKIREAPRVY